MRTVFLSLLLLASSLLATPTVLVSIAPHKFFVETIAGPTVKIISIVPKGVSSHTYEPTPRQIMDASTADIWFQIGEFFEPQAATSLQHFSPNLQQIDLRTNLDLINDHPCSHNDCRDPHIWLSAKLAKQQAETIAAALTQKYPQNSELYKKNLQLFLEQLDQLDRDLATTLSPIKGKIVLVAHPSYGYLARDYGFSQLAIEQEGKDPSAHEVTNILQKARSLRIKKVFTEPQHSAKGASVIASKIGAQTVQLDPLSEDYFKNMRHIAKEFASE